MLEIIYREFRLPIIRAVSSLGGSTAAGNVFFMTAVVEGARQVRAGEWPVATPFFYQLKALALAHFNDWIAERGQDLPPQPEPDPEAAGYETVIPPVEQLRVTRDAITAWRRPADAGINVPADPDGKRIWDQLRAIERSVLEGASGSPATKKTNRILTYGIIAAVILVIGYLAYIQYNRVQTPAEVYGSNFNPPKSIMEDLHARHGAEMGNDSVGARSNACDEVLVEADRLYQQKDYEAAAQSLMAITEADESVCKSDAFFYLGIIGLQLDRPGLTLQCFSKIEDIERYGEDLYWYQALAFVKLASKNPTLHDKAVGAVERAESNTQDPQRREQAEQMLKQLSR